MAKSKSQQRREAVMKAADDSKVAETTAPKKTPAAATVRLKLKQREFVRGKLCEADSIHEFSPEDAKKRLETTDKWLPA